MFDGVQAEAKRVRESSLGHPELVSDALYVDLVRHMDLEALLRSSEKSFNLVQSSHELIKCALHGLPPEITAENVVGTLLQGITFGLAEIFLLVFRKYRNEKDREFIVSPNINDARPSSLSHAGARHANFPKPSSSRHDIIAVGVECNRRYNLFTPFLTEKLSRNGEVRGRFNNGLYIHLYSIGHLRSRNGGTPGDTVRVRSSDDNPVFLKRPLFSCSRPPTQI
jgi:hypothetical protein